jgi:crotonobetaine/carnitine-CoA ligase
MGDMGYCDEAGWLYFMHRSGGGVRRNGDFIDTASVEKILAEHSAIKDVFVYGVPATSGAAGEKDLVAAIEISSEASFDKFAIFEYCRERLDNNAVPSYLQIVAAIPKTASEKPLERLLLDSFSSVNPDVFTRQ